MFVYNYVTTITKGGGPGACLESQRSRARLLLWHSSLKDQNVSSLLNRKGPEGLLSSPFGYYTNMVQQKTFIIHVNIKPLPAICFSQGQGHRSKVEVKNEKILLTR